MHHIHRLRSHFNKSLRAKQAYHSLVTGHLHKQLLVARIRHRVNSLHHDRKTKTICHAAKHIVTTLYYDSTTVIYLARRYKQHVHRSQELYDTRPCYTQCMMNHTKDCVYREGLATHAHQSKRTLYQTAT